MANLYTMIRNVLLIFCLLLSLGASAQYIRTVSYKPNAAKGQDATLNYSRGCTWSGRTGPNETLNFGNDPYLPYMAWTFDSLGCPGLNTTISVIRFADMDTIPRKRTSIISATLRLFGINNDGWYGFNYYPGSARPYNNSGLVQLLSSPWSESTVTYNTRPLPFTTPQATIPASTSQFNFNVSVDVTKIVDSMMHFFNYGFMLQMMSDTAYRSAIFASSDYTIDTTFWPQLDIVYADTSCVTARFGSERINCYAYQFSDSSIPVPGIGVATWSWDFGDGKTSTLKNPRDTFPAYGNYTVLLRVMDSNGCADTVSHIIAIVPPAHADWVVNDTSTCISGGADSITLHATPGATAYAWSPNWAFDNPNSPDPRAGLSGSINTFYLTVTDLLGCLDYDTVTVHLNAVAPIHISPHDTSGCMGVPVQLQATGAKKFKWVPAIGLSSDTLADPVLSIPGTISYTITGTDSSGCISHDTIYITQLPTPILTVTAESQAIDCAHDYVQLHARGASDLRWEPAGLCSDSHSADPKVSPATSTMFSVTGKNEIGCISKDSVLVTYSGRTVVVVPNAFTPNGDKINDVLTPIIQCDFVLLDFNIFDRWGKAVFTSYDTNRGWDGTFNGGACSSGSYYYMLRGRDHFNKDVVMKGDITLVR